MKLYRFSPVTSEEALLEAIRHIHFASYQLCKDAFGHYYPNAGNMGFFCHYDDEYQALTNLRKQLCETADEPDRKYYRLLKPIVIPARGDVPETTYTYLYIRKPEPYRSQVGDIDFYLSPKEYAALKQQLQSGTGVPGARPFPRTDLDMIELLNPDIDVLAYLSPMEMTEKVRIKVPGGPTQLG